MQTLRKANDKIYLGIYDLSLLKTVDATIIEAEKLTLPLFSENAARYQKLDYDYVRLASDGEGYVQTSVVVSAKQIVSVDRQRSRSNAECDSSLLKLLIKARKTALETALNAVNLEWEGFAYSSMSNYMQIGLCRSELEMLNVIDRLWEGGNATAEQVGRPLDAFEQSLFSKVWRKYQMTVEGADMRQTTRTAVGKALNSFDFLVRTK